MKKETEVRKFFLFNDGEARELLISGWFEVITDFDALYKRLTAEGFTEI